MNPRYFIGILLPDDLRHMIAGVQHELFQPGNVMQPLKPHITLLHPDELSTLHPLHFVPKIKEVADQLLPVKIKLDKVSMFDKRVLYLNVLAPDLTKLHQYLATLLPEDVLAQYHVSRPFHPHVTLAQAKPNQDLSPELVTEFCSRIEPLLPQTFSAQNLTEFRWLRPRVYKINDI